MVWALRELTSLWRDRLIVSMYKQFNILILCGLLSGCAVGPLVSHETARTVGSRNSELIGGYGQAGYVFKWNYGLGKDFDIGLHWESLSIGLRAKYAFINSSNGFSLAAALGIGESLGGSHYYGDILFSYLVKKFEPYGTIRLVHVKTDPVEFRDEDTGHVDFTVRSYKYDYGQGILGARIWFNKNWFLSLEASTLFTVSDDVEIADGVLLGAALGARF